MQGIADIMMTTIGWSVVLIILPKLKKQENSPFLFWMFLLFFSVSFTLQIDPLYLAIDNALPINNLTWWCSYLSIIIAMEFLVRGCDRLRGKTTSAGVRYLALLTTITTGAIYLFYLSKAPESIAHDNPRTWAEVVYIAVLHLYVITMLYIGPVTLFSEMVQREVVLSGRLRAIMFLTSAVGGLVWQILKFTRVVFILFLRLSLIESLTKLFPILLSISALSLLLAFLPNEIYSRMAYRIEKGLEVWALIQSRWLALQLEPLWRPLVVAAVPWEVQLRQPSLYLRRQVVYIFDCRKALTDEACEQAGEQGQRLYSALQSLKDSDEYAEMVRECCRISRYLWIKMLRDKLSIKT
jgi:hypothetical protein